MLCCPFLGLAALVSPLFLPLLTQQADYSQLTTLMKPDFAPESEKTGDVEQMENSQKGKSDLASVASFKC